MRLLISIFIFLSLNLFSQTARIDSSMTIKDSIVSNYTWFRWKEEGEKRTGLLRVDFYEELINYVQLTIQGTDVFYWNRSDTDGTVTMGNNNFYYIRNERTSALSIKKEGDVFKPILFLRNMKNPYIYTFFKYKNK
jgi:hypothetical protein